MSREALGGTMLVPDLNLRQTPLTTLKDLCLDSLARHGMRYLGSLPDHCITDVMRRSGHGSFSVQDLLQIEKCNPRRDLSAVTDPVWRRKCLTDFRKEFAGSVPPEKVKPKDMTWGKLYRRMHSGRDAKRLQSVRAMQARRKSAAADIGTMRRHESIRPSVRKSRPARGSSKKATKMLRMPIAKASPTAGGKQRIRALDIF